MGALVQIRVGPGDVVARIDEHAIEFRCEDRLAVQYDGIHGTTWPVAGGQEATIAAVERAGGHLINVADAHWLHQRPRRPKDHDGESVILEPIRAGYIGGIVVLIRFAADSALRKAHLRVPGYFRRHHYDLDLRGVTLEGEARDELLRHLAAELGAGRVAVAGRPLRVPRRPFRWSDRIFIEKTSPSLASLAWAVIMHLRGKGMPLVAMGLVLSAALVVTGLHEALYRPRSPSRPRG
ncbi:MAG: hypothetical protein HYV09_16245 [Deltaproteobacteria bacterium]|nr:hypothetical protein [Deltaproteobacteria bacterium]